MAQRIDPDSDISTGLWTVTPLYQKIDDGASANDADEIVSVELAAIDLTDAFEVGLSNPAATPGTGDTVVTVRAKRFGSGAEMDFELFEGVDSRGTQVVTNIATTYTNYTLTVASGIVNFNNLSVLVTVIKTAIPANGDNVKVSWIKCDVPDATAAGAAVVISKRIPARMMKGVGL